MPETLISSEVDFDADSNQQGFLHLLHSVHRSAYGRIPLPIVVIQNGNGPITLLISGNQGDENEGQIALTKHCREFESGDEVSDYVRAIHHPQEQWREPTLVKASHSGIILCKRFQGRVERGEYFYQIAIDLKETMR